LQSPPTTHSSGKPRPWPRPQASYHRAAVQGYTKGYAFAVAGLTGLVEPAAGLVGAQLVLSWALTFAAGAMIYPTRRMVGMERVAGRVNAGNSHEGEPLRAEDEQQSYAEQDEASDQVGVARVGRGEAGGGV